MRQQLIRKPERSAKEQEFLAQMQKLASEDRVNGHYRRDETADALERYCREHDMPEELADEAMRTAWPGNRHDGPPLIAPPKANKQTTVNAAVSKKPVPLLVRWLRTVSSPAGPKGAAMRGVLHTLILYAGDRNRADGGGVFPGLKRLAQDAGTSRTALKRYLRRLEDAGWIARTRRWQPMSGEWASSAYEFTLPKGVGPISGLRNVALQRVKLLPPTQRGRQKRWKKR